MSLTVRKRTHSVNGTSSSSRSITSEVVSIRRARTPHARGRSRSRRSSLTSDVLPDVHSVQFEIGNTRTCSPCDLAVVEFQSSGAGALGHWPKSSRKEKIRPARSVPRRAARRRSPRRTGSTHRVEQRRGLQLVAEAWGPVCSTTRPLSIDCCTEAHEPLAELGHAPIAVLDDLGKVVPVSTCISGKGKAGGSLLGMQQHDRVLAA